MADSPASSSSDSASVNGSTVLKRNATDAGLKTSGGRPAKSVKRRASKACQCCRARKVRCNVVEHGAPCTNCRLDEVECIVSESKRKKKWTSADTGASPQSIKGPVYNRLNSSSLPLSAHPPYEPLKRLGDHVPHTLYQDLDKEHIVNNTDPIVDSRPSSLYSPNMLMSAARLSQRTSSLSETPPLLASLIPQIPTYSLPAYIKPLHNRLNPDDIMYLEKKGALTIPPIALRDQLLKSYAEFIHPYMPLLNLQQLVHIIDLNDGSQSISLLLFQAIMFAGVASVDMRYLKGAGYTTRREARREFFTKARLLYDFDYEVDRVSLIQALLLMTYWYETPDDQKDSHHWMGIAVSLAHTIGLHRNPSKSSSIDTGRQRLWKRIWWSIYMRDRLIALGMRRPTRIKTADFDVPMLTLDDFDDDLLPNGPSCMPADCSVLRDKEKQRKLAVMCIAKVKLCICISHVLSVQYSVLHNNHGVISEEGSTKTTMMLVAKRLEPEMDELQACDDELRQWEADLPPEAKYAEPTWDDLESGNQDVALNLSLLHLIYYATYSALHRPQVLPSNSMPPRVTQAEELDRSRKAVRLAANEITAIGHRLYNLDLVRYLPTPGVTVLLPAIIIHLLDIKAPEEATRRASLHGFCQCMQIMAKLRDIYAAADYSTAFLEAAIRKAEITLPPKSNEIRQSRNIITSAQGLLDAGRRMDQGNADSNALTPPPDEQHSLSHHKLRFGTDMMTHVHDNIDPMLSDDDIARRLNSFLASTPPDSETQVGDALDFGPPSFESDDVEPDFDSMINLDAAGETWILEDGAFAAMQGESSGFTMDIDWMGQLCGDEVEEKKNLETRMKMELDVHEKGNGDGNVVRVDAGKDLVRDARVTSTTMAEIEGIDPEGAIAIAASL